ncbi:Fluoroacetate dehalogenase [Paramyrothecium foliicola]|nr:Fluoroacetate dehalogenase [Paramyrothecium foliicola]
MFESFESFEILTQREPEVIIRGIKSKPASSSPDNGLPPLLLLHGFPQTRHMWHRVAPQLTEKYTVVIPDLRGYGESSKPDAVADYVKSAMARDFVAVMDKLGFDSFFICAHDRGARVSHKLSVDFPDRVRKLIILDICPTLAMYTTTNFDFARAYYHWFFLIQPAPLPETLISASPRRYLELTMGGSDGKGLSIFDKDCIDQYARVMEDPDAVHGMCNDYRASATLDLEEQREDLSKGRRIQSPLLVLWGKHGVIEKGFNAVKEWQAVTDGKIVVQGYNVESGHYIPEQRPGEVVSAILEFLV